MSSKVTAIEEAGKEPGHVPECGDCQRHEKATRRARRAFLAGAVAAAILPAAAVGGVGAFLLRFWAIPAFWRRRHKGMVIHHSATPPEGQARLGAREINEMHKHRFPGVRYKGRNYYIGYHYVIRPDGAIEPGRPEGVMGGHAKSWKHNYWAGVCLIGYFDKKWQDPRYHRPSRAQMKSLVSLSHQLMKRHGFGKDRILGHKQIDATECPGKNFPMKEYMAMLDSLPEGNDLS